MDASPMIEDMGLSCSRKEVMQGMAVNCLIMLYASAISLKVTRAFIGSQCSLARTGVMPLIFI